MSPRLTRFATAAVLQLAALVLAHQLVYMARYGSRFGEALVHSGHGEAWTAAVITSLVLVAGLAAVAGVRLIRLGVRVRRVAGAIQASYPETLDHGALVAAWLRLAPRMVALSLVLLTVQENVEHVAAGLGQPGPGVLLSQEYAGGAWITIAVALLVSLAAALFEWRHRVLLARLRAARARLPRARALAPMQPRVAERRPVESLLGRRSALRAPPVPVRSA
jgi:hypothetical protein